jgi:hypothetical protein
MSDPIFGRGAARAEARAEARALAVKSPRAAFRHLLPRLLLGTWLAALGIAFTLDNVGIVDASDWLRWWPVLLVALGAGLLISATSPGELAGGVAWMVVGGALLLDRLDVLPVNVSDLWPLALVVFGGLLVVRALRPRSGISGDESSTVHAFAMMSGVTRKSASVTFEGGSLTAIMGGVEVDLRSARMVQKQAVIDCFAFWGGIDVKVPPGWVVHGRVWPLMGGYEDKTTPPAPEDVEGELVITGWAIMGGVAVKTARE